MRLSKPVVRSIVLILGALMLCGVGHVLLFGVDFLECFPQFFCGVLTLIWAMSVQKRVTDPRLMRLLLNFHPIPSQLVPGDSILRASIGGSQLSY